MKKLITALLLLALAVPAFSQEFEIIDQNLSDQKWSVKATAGYLPTVPVLIDLFGGIFVGVAIGLNKDANETLEFSLPPYAAVEALYDFDGRWSAGVSTGYLGTAFKIVDKDTRAVKSVSYITLVPLTVEGRCNYLNRPAVKLYGSLEAGAIFSVGSGDFSVAPDFQINPFGVEFGRRLFGVVEFGIGMNYTGVRGGIGYRF